MCLLKEFADIDYPIDNRISSGIRKIKDMKCPLYAKFDYQTQMFNFENF